MNCLVENEFKITNSSANKLSATGMRMTIKKLNSNPDEYMQYETVRIETYQDFSNYNPGLISINDMKNLNRKLRKSYLLLFYVFAMFIFLILW